MNPTNAKEQLEARLIAAGAIGPVELGVVLGFIPEVLPKAIAVVGKGGETPEMRRILARAGASGTVKGLENTLAGRGLALPEAHRRSLEAYAEEQADLWADSQGIPAAPVPAPANATPPVRPQAPPPVPHPVPPPVPHRMPPQSPPPAPRPAAAPAGPSIGERLGHILEPSLQKESAGAAFTAAPDTGGEWHEPGINPLGFLFRWPPVIPARFAWIPVALGLLCGLMSLGAVWFERYDRNLLDQTIVSTGSGASGSYIFSGGTTWPFAYSIYLCLGALALSGWRSLRGAGRTRGLERALLIPAGITGLGVIVLIMFTPAHTLRSGSMLFVIAVASATYSHFARPGKPTDR